MAEPVGGGVEGPAKGDTWSQNQRICLKGCYEGLCLPKYPTTHTIPFRLVPFPMQKTNDLFLGKWRWPKLIEITVEGMGWATWLTARRLSKILYSELCSPQSYTRLLPDLQAAHTYQTRRQGSSFLHSRELASQFRHLQPGPEQNPLPLVSLPEAHVFTLGACNGCCFTPGRRVSRLRSARHPRRTFEMRENKTAKTAKNVCLLIRAPFFLLQC